MRFVGGNVRRLRLRRHLTQERLAEEAGCELRYVQTIERGKANVTLDLLVALADALDVEPRALLREAVLAHARRGRPPAH